MKQHLVKSFFKIYKNPFVKWSLLFASIFLVGFLVSYIYTRFFKNKDGNGYNVIILSVDTLRQDRMGVYGYQGGTTPNIDEWSKDATVFNNAYTVSPLTVPSFTALFTGKHPYQTRIISNESFFLSPRTLTIPEVLTRHGYKTAAFVANSVLSPSAKNFSNDFRNYRSYPSWSSSDQDHETLVNDAISWLKGAGKQKFFLWVHLADPHGPYSPKYKYRCLENSPVCKKIDSKSYEQWEKERLNYVTQAQPQKTVLKGCNPETPPPNLDVYSSLYDGEIKADDEQMGKIFMALKDLGLDKNTIVLFYGDHGEGFDHDYFYTHGGTAYQSHIKIPLIVKHPKSKGGNVSQMVLNTDVISTLTNLLGLNIDKTYLDSVPFDKFIKTTFTNIFQGKRKAAFFEAFQNYAVIKGDYKYIFYADKENCYDSARNEELFNIKLDPEEKTNLLYEKGRVHFDLKTMLYDKFDQYELPKSHLRPEDEAEELEKLKSLGY